LDKIIESVELKSKNQLLIMNKYIVFIVCIFFTFVANGQTRKDRNLSKRQTFYYDPTTRTQVEITGYYYVDELGETTERHGQWTYYNRDGVKVEERQYNRNKLHGEVKTYYGPNRVKDLGYFKNDVQDSLYVAFGLSGDTLEVGYYDMGTPIGEWRYFYADGSLKSVEEIRDGVSYIWEFYAADSLRTHLVKEGTGEMVDYYANGRLKSWYNFKNGLKDGPFEEASVYGMYTVKGSFSNNKPDGKWEHYFITGDLEKVVHYKDGQLHGGYINYYDNGQVRVEGEHENGMKTGKWSWYTNSGVLDQEGTFKNGLQHGTWIYNYPDGKLSYRARYKDGKKDGKWTYYYKNGKKFREGVFKEDVQHGLWQTWYENGVLLMTGEYVEGKEQGLWQNYWENGQLKNESTFVDGELHGEWLSFYLDGVPASKGNYKNGLKSGEWIDYFSNGRVSDINNYKVIVKKSKVKKGTLKDRKHLVSARHGKSVSYSQKDYTKMMEGRYRNDEKTGKWITYHPGGVLPAVIAHYKNGKLNGKMETYEFLGNTIISSIEYKDGVRHGKAVFYDREGKVKSTMQFKDGMQVIETSRSGAGFTPGR